MSETVYDWILGVPVQTDTNYEWILGTPYIIYEYEAAAAGIVLQAMHHYRMLREV